MYPEATMAKMIARRTPQGEKYRSGDCLGIRRDRRLHAR
jgi:hypothetical protein